MTTGPRMVDLWADALRRVRRPLTPTVVTLLIVVAGGLAVFGTTGVSLAGQQRALERMNSPQGRVIVVTDSNSSAGLSPRSVAPLQSLSGVEWVLAVGSSQDVNNARIPGSPTVVARPFWGRLPAPLRAAPERLQPGQAVADSGVLATLGLTDGVGAVTGRTLSATIVGVYSPVAPLTELAGGVLVLSEQPIGRVKTIWVSVGDVSDVPRVSDAVRDVVVADRPGDLRVETSADLARLSGDVIAQMAATARTTLMGLLLAVTLLIGAVQYGRVSSMARDIGRRRALGASRTTIVVMVMLNAVLVGVIGAALGAVLGSVAVRLIAGVFSPVSFSLGVAVLLVLASLTGSLWPALRAARLDPVQILRVP